MTHQPNCFSNTIMIATLLTIGCTGSGMAGCGSDSSSDPSGAVDVNSDLVGIYTVDSYQSSPVDGNGDPVPDSCDQLSDLNAGGFIVLYGFRPSPTDDPRIGGVFCETVEQCEDVARRGPEPTVGYSFVAGSDEAGWTGYAILGVSDNGADCVTRMQVHTLDGEGSAITINTNEVEVTHPADIPDASAPDEAVCTVPGAINALVPEQPCLSRLLLAGTRN